MVYSGHTFLHKMSFARGEFSVTKIDPDHIDKEIIRLLMADGRMRTAQIAEELSVTTPTVRSRMKMLIQAGLLRMAGLLNHRAAPELITALIGIDIDSRGKLAEQLENLTALEQVSWAAVVTGRFDIIAEVVFSGGMQDLFNFTTQVLPTIGRITHCETFVVMHASNKWLLAPKGLDKW
jgi:Lrp/AsnC family transcriptional regulator, regulator for asnA, asnC and gidA